MTDKLVTCECGGKYLKTTRGQKVCPDCEELVNQDPPDVLDLIEGTKYRRKRYRDAAQSLDNFDERG